MLSVADSRPMARPKSEGNSPVMPAPRRHCSHWLSTTVWMCGHCATIWRQWKANSPLTASAGPVLDCCVVGDMGKMGQALATARLQPLPAPGKMAGTPGWSRLLHWAGAQLGHVRFLADWGSVRHEDYSNPSATSWVSGKHRHEDDTPPRLHGAESTRSRRLLHTADRCARWHCRRLHVFTVQQTRSMQLVLTIHSLFTKRRSTMQYACVAVQPGRRGRAAL